MTPQERQGLAQIVAALRAGTAQYPDQVFGDLAQHVGESDRSAACIGRREGIGLCALATVAVGGMPHELGGLALVWDILDHTVGGWAIKRTLTTQYFGRDNFVTVPNPLQEGAEMELFDLIEALNDGGEWDRERIAAHLESLAKEPTR